ncbi:MAG TPA: hypothetical protein VFD70_14835 [Anaerolineae bacterium]|nr:hypothetical protein [Anaerolineae bacterium]
MIPESFSFLEATKLIGAVFETVTDYYTIPAGTRGRVVDFMFVAPYDLVIEWESNEIPKIYCTMVFSKTQVNRYLRRVDIKDSESSEAYTESEARGLVGKAFENVVNFSLIPKGTQGNIVDSATRKDGSAVVVVQWRIPNRSHPHTSWFTKAEVQRLGRIVQ